MWDLICQKKASGKFPEVEKLCHNLCHGFRSVSKSLCAASCALNTGVWAQVRSHTFSLLLSAQARLGKLAAEIFPWVVDVETSLVSQMKREVEYEQFPSCHLECVRGAPAPEHILTSLSIELSVLRPV